MIFILNFQKYENCPNCGKKVRIAKHKLAITRNTNLELRKKVRIKRKKTVFWEIWSELWGKKGTCVINKVTIPRQSWKSGKKVLNEILDFYFFLCGRNRT